jgi:putative transcriptional regulator
MRIHCRLREYIEDADLTQSDVAEATGLSPTIVGNLYHDRFLRIDCGTAIALCQYFQVGLGEMFTIGPD